MVGCTGGTSGDLQALGAALRALRRLAVGGAVMSWREEVALPGEEAGALLVRWGNGALLAR